MWGRYCGPRCPLRSSRRKTQPKIDFVRHAQDNVTLKIEADKALLLNGLCKFRVTLVITLRRRASAAQQDRARLKTISKVIGDPRLDDRASFI